MEPINRKIWDFQVLQSKFVKSLMSILKRKIDSSPNFVSLFSFMKDNSSVLFSLNNIYFAQKEPLKVNIFWIFECSGQNLSNFIHQFWNNKCKEIVPDVLDPNQNVQITCNSKVYITEKFIHQKGAEKRVKDELSVFSYTS